VRKGGLVLVIAICAVTAGCSSGGGTLSGNSAGGFSPGHGSPKAATDGFVTDLLSGGTSWCSYVDPADQAGCVTLANESQLTATGTFQIRNQVIQGNEALVSVTGTLCAHAAVSGTTSGGCGTNTDPNAGLPPGAGTFAVAYSAAENNSNATINAVACIEVNGSWWVNFSAAASTTPTTVPASTPTTTPTTVPTSTPTTTPSPATTTATTVVP